MAKSADEWSAEWPTEPGWYWFYGWRSKFDQQDGQPPRLGACRVHRSPNSLACVLDGQFHYQAEARGVWLPMIVPNLPDLTELNLR